MAIAFLAAKPAGNLLFAQTAADVPGHTPTVLQSAAPASTATLAARDAAVAYALARAYDPARGTFTGTGWWNSANGITALADAARALGTTDFDALFPASFSAAQTQFAGFLNPFYDDEGWWALAWLDVYRFHPEPRYLALSASIFADMQGGWSDVCGGGIWWKKDVHYKNAIANELFFELAVQLAQATEGPTRAGYLRWAEKGKTWFLGSGMLNGDSLVNDGLTPDCHNNHEPTWTYNQGVLIGGLTGLYQLAGDRADLETASRIANAAAAQLTDSAGVLHDRSEPHCGADGVQFKGILVRNLVPLQRLAPSPAVKRMLAASTRSAWAGAQTAAGAFACDWSGPPVDDGTGTLISVLDLLTAELETTRSGAPTTHPASGRIATTPAVHTPPTS